MNNALSPLVNEYQKTLPDPNADALTQAASIPTGAVPPMQENWAQYAGDPTHPMLARVGSAAVEEARRFGAGIKNDLQRFIGPMYGEGHVPQFNEGVSGTDYAGAGLNLASLLQGPGSETGVGAGWNTGAGKYLDNLMKAKPPLKPETAAAVQQMISKGPGWAKDFIENAPDGTPGKGFASLATLKHNVEEAAKPKSSPVSVAQPGTGLPVPAGSPASVSGKPPMPAGFTSSYGTPAYNAPTPLKKPPVKTVASTPQTAQQALFGGPGTAVHALAQQQLEQLMQMHISPLSVPEMLPYDPTKTGLAALSHETAPGTSGKMTPFNPEGLPMDDPTVMKRMQEQGFAPIGGNWLFWRGVQQKGPFSWDSAAMGYKDPAGKTNEPGIFLHPDVSAKGKPGKVPAAKYAMGGPVNPHVVRADNPLVKEWKDVAGGKDYSSPAMQKAIKDAWAKGHDALLLKNIVDVGGNHDQLIVRSPNQLRHPHAVFNPKFKNTPNLLAAGGPGGVTLPLVARPEDMNEGGQNDQQ